MYEHGKGLGADGSIEMSKCNLQARIAKVLLLTLQKYKIETNGIVYKLNLNYVKSLT